MLLDGAQNTVAVVDAYCKQAAPADGQRCRLVSRPVAANASGRSLASSEVGSLRLTEVDSH
ncbi:hypothetical protein RHOFW510R12_16145 [Rhodanobacter sp. FW510-R12]|nr:hypothetical protein RHOFW104R8_05495 [Rhodanobacter sp. FW104-R8]KZC25876.1 hypothetical protein RhoFW510T8_05100 [Rhodanobacter sp. FW510-T8]KZC33751.1 hypothetical protein RhoFW510R10_06810 [Rhodanobacter sp. FW510-R10]